MKKQLLLSWYECKRLLGHPLRMLFLLLLFFVLIMIGQRALGNGQTLPQVVIVDEDKSVEVRTFVENVAYNKLKNTVRFKETSLEEGLVLLEQELAIGVIHIPEGTRDSLDTLAPAGMQLYIKDSKDIRVQLLIGYMSDMVDLLNEGQSGAMVYWKEMSKEGILYEDRLKALESISFDYGVAFLTRGDVFSVNDVKDPLEGILPLQYYGYSLIWGLIIVSSLMAHISSIQDKTLGLKRRLLLSGFTSENYFWGRVLTGTLFSIVCLLILLLLFKTLLGISLLSLNLGVWSIALWVIVLINAYMVLAIENSSNKKAVAIFVIALAILSYTSGLIIPEFYLSAPSKLLASINLINFGDNIFKGYPLATWRTILPFIYSVLLWKLYKMTHAKVVA